MNKSVIHANYVSLNALESPQWIIVNRLSRSYGFNKQKQIYREYKWVCVLLHLCIFLNVYNQT